MAKLKKKNLVWKLAGRKVKELDNNKVFLKHILRDNNITHLRISMFILKSVNIFVYWSH